MYRLAANWPFLLISQIARGQFFVRPEEISGLLDQAREIIGQRAVKLSTLRPRRSLQLTAVSESLSRTSFLLREWDDEDELDEEEQMDPWANAAPGSTAIIPVKGTMLKYGTWCSYGTKEIAAMVREAADHKNIGSLVLDIDSGGGAVDAVAPLTEAIRYAKSKGKPVVASVDLAASAAYWTASETDYIVADNSISAIVGSIGVMMQLTDYRELQAKAGVKTHLIYSTYSEHKHEGHVEALDGDYTIMQKQFLDPMAKSFQEAVKKNRAGKLKADVEGILSGRTFFSDEAKSYGLIDKLGDSMTAVQVAQTLTHAKNLS
ncbi:S49 family peptidase [uncultured Algoriphagus sp.]|uniref:S49 family peptidase n=1 Tax=uncultured Algoriphagus sp. TaxID=417365 RepID=UPI002585CF37|nr:S49 family peptidase [uncultured Algoriphagus sp.]